MSYHRILTIQDISCVGHCSMTVVLPVISACGQECCILPSAVLSTHTGGFGKPAVRNLMDSMESIRNHWKEAGITFNAIYVGYLGSLAAVQETKVVMKELLAPGGKIIIDPAMADHGKLYSGFDEAYAEAMKDLCSHADVVMPNITEAAILAGIPYQEELTKEYVETLLQNMGDGDTVLTGVGFAPNETGAAIRRKGGIHYVSSPKVGRGYHGTGDLFAAAFTGAWVGGKTMEEAADIAAKFVCRCVENTVSDLNHWYGTKFETAIPYLIELLK